MATSKKMTPPVTVEGGSICGLYEEGGQVAVFKGVPYAKPPLGDLRWKPPRPVDPWDGIREAKAFSPMSLQLGVDINVFLKELVEGQGWGVIKTLTVKMLLAIAPRPKQSENCLYLNIRTPALDKEAKLPVMVWIHGGDHQDGSGSDIYYHSNALVHRGLVVVTINYRLGLLGYFTHPELNRESAKGVSGNYGTLDQIAALRWVRDNIETFGGDPDNVTIFGESAGGESVAHMMASPLARGLFQKAIMQSAANSGQMIHLKQPFLDHQGAEEMGSALANKLVPAKEDQLNSLRRIPAKKLYQALRRQAKALRSFYPVIDGYVLEKSPFESFLEGEQAQVPLLLGSNSDEGTLIYPIFHAPLSGYKNKTIQPNEMSDLIKKEFGDNAGTLFDLYSGLREGTTEASASLLGDAMFGSPARFYALQAARAGQPVFMYFFTQTPPSPKQTTGAHHGAELPFVHDSSSPIFPMTEQDLRLAKVMGDYWAQFAKTGNPNISPHPEWPCFSLRNQMYMKLGDKIAEVPVERKAKYDILDRRLLRQIEEMKRIRQIQPQ